MVLQEFPRIRTMDSPGGGFAAGTDALRHGAPVSPLWQSIAGPALEFGFTDAARALRIPLDSARVTFPGHRFAESFVPFVAADEAEARDLARRAAEALEAELPRMASRWEREHAPAANARSARLGSMPVEQAPLSAVPGLLDEALRIAKQCAATHFRIALPAAYARASFAALCARHGADGAVDELVVPEPTALLVAELGLSDLASAARAAGLAPLLLETPAERVLDTLHHAPMGLYYAAAVRDYLREHGLRQERCDLASPTWQEAPQLAIARIQAYLRGGHNARGRYKARAATAERALEAIRATLAGASIAERANFEAALDAARTAAFVMEEQRIVVEERTLALLRGFFLRLGARLAAIGTIARADDVFMLSIDELKRLTGEASDSRAICRTHLLTLEREAELARAAAEPVVVTLADDPADRAVRAMLALANAAGAAAR